MASKRLGSAGMKDRLPRQGTAGSIRVSEAGLYHGSCADWLRTGRDGAACLFLQYLRRPPLALSTHPAETRI